MSSRWRMMATVAGAMAIVFSGAVQKLCAQPCPSARFLFAPKQTLPATSFDVFHPQVGDFNRDGIDDVVGMDPVGGGIRVFLGNRIGGLTPLAPLALGIAPVSSAVGDFNRDGRQDLAVLNDTADTISILHGNGSGGFTLAATLNGATGSRLIVGEFHGDGLQDLVTGNLLYAGNAAGNFTGPTTLPVTGSVFNIATGDLNRDGKNDLAFPIFATDSVAVLLGNGNGTFGAQTNFGVADSPISINLADLNRDGRLDIMTGNQSGQNVSVLLANAAGSFGVLTNFGVGNAARSMAVGDLNGDGIPDIVTGNAASFNQIAQPVTVLIGNGSGGFAAPAPFLSLIFAHVAIGDFNADGKNDIFVSSTDTVTDTAATGVLQNACGGLTHKPKVDFDGDGLTVWRSFAPRTEHGSS